MRIALEALLIKVSDYKTLHNRRVKRLESPELWMNNPAPVGNKTPQDVVQVVAQLERCADLGMFLNKAMRTW